jgi:outer membrane murein-binding lipoprotein Lpp
MRRIFIAMIAGGFLLLSGVAASAKPDSGNGQQSQKGQQQTQTQNDQKATQPPAKPATTPAAKPATKPAATTACGETGDNTGDHQHEDAAACNDQNEQAGVNESKTNANDAAGGNNED